MLWADLSELLAGSVSITGQMMDGAGCDLFLWSGFIGKVGAHLPRRLVDHGLRIVLIHVSVGKN